MLCEHGSVPESKSRVTKRLPNSPRVVLIPKGKAEFLETCQARLGTRFHVQSRREFSGSDGRSGVVPIVTHILPQPI